MGFALHWPATVTAGLGGLPLGVIHIPSETPLELPKCLFANGCQVERASGLGVEGSLCPFILSVLVPVQPEPVLLATISITSYVHQLCCV